MGNITLKQLAGHLNLSAATVSKALNNSHEISEATKLRVWAAAHELNYRPNPFGSGLRKHQSRTIAVILPQVADNFFAQSINGIEEVARKHNYHVLICLTHESAEREREFFELLSNGRVDGIVISLASGNSDFAHLEELGNDIPIVFFDRICESSRYYVTTNDFESSLTATNHLLDKGCGDIVYLHSLSTLNAGKQRLAGYHAALESRGSDLNPELIVDCTGTDAEVLAAIKNILLKKKPDGILSSIEKLAGITYQACKELGLHIPSAIKVVSFSNLDSVSLWQPPLTTITQPAFEIGTSAASLLFGMLKSATFIPDSHTFPSVLMARESTG